MREHKNNRNKGLFVLGSIYPMVTGGMEIFNYHFLKYQLDTLAGENYYWTDNELAGHKKLHLKIWRFRPTRFFHPLQLLLLLLKFRSRVTFIYTGYARQSWVIPYFSALVFRLFRIPYIVTIHSGGKPDWKRKYPYRYYFRNACRLIGVSETICEDYGNLIPEKKILYIPPLIPFQQSQKTKEEIRSQLNIGQDDKVLLFVGTLKKMKKPDKILQAFKILGNAFLAENRLRIVIAGKGEMMEELENYVQANDLSTFVIFKGLVPRESIPDFFAMSDYYIISSDYEGTSVSLLEAMFNKLPIIAADSPGLNSMLTAGQNALLYPTENAEKLANCIRTLVFDSRLCEKLAENGNQHFSRNYSYELMIEKYEKLFNSIIL
jgi:glycosyltransferase involved in cell wall biosynthesis